jgi:hypothetical protein
MRLNHGQGINWSKNSFSLVCCRANIVNQEMFEVRHAAAFCEPQFYEAWDHPINYVPEFV